MLFLTLLFVYFIEGDFIEGDIDFVLKKYVGSFYIFLFEDSFLSTTTDYLSTL